MQTHPTLRLSRLIPYWVIYVFCGSIVPAGTAVKRGWYSESDKLRKYYQKSHPQDIVKTLPKKQTNMRINHIMVLYS